MPNAAHRRRGVRRDVHQVQFRLVSLFHGFLDANDTELVAVRIYQAYFLCTNFFVDERFFANCRVLRNKEKSGA